MESNKALIQSLRKLSSRFNKLVDRALKEEITIISLYQYLRVFSQHYPICDGDRKKMLGAANFPEIGIKKAIVVNLQEVRDTINDEYLGIGMVEQGFAHEIGHNLSWECEPNCARDFSSGRPEYLGCAYREALADKISFRLIKEAKTKRGEGKLFFCRQYRKPIEIAHMLGYPSAFIKEYKSCPALKVHQLPSCPKSRQIEKLVKEIEELGEK
ncbi:hypothetical protein MYX07_04680 [Patescibacteria group bacterium AH-259-L07]|nr:hypothetical protein [Patescibacteria group bacterium AH-259-L07]